MDAQTVRSSSGATARRTLARARSIADFRLRSLPSRGGNATSTLDDDSDSSTRSDIRSSEEDAAGGATRNARDGGSTEGEQRDTQHTALDIAQAPSSSIPWSLRTTTRTDTSRHCWCLGSRYLLSRVEFAFRVAVLACLPPALLIASSSTRSSFVSHSLATTIAAVVARETIGQSLQTLAELVRCSFLWLPLASLAAWLELHRRMAWWWPVYIVGAIVMGTLCDGLTRKLALLFFTLCMVATLGNDPIGQQVDYPARLCGDAFVGAAFGLLASILPPFRSSMHLARRSLERVFDNVSVCYTGLSEAFWARTNVTRSVDLARVRFVITQLHEAKQQCLDALADAEYECLGASHTLREMHESIELCRELKYCLDSLMRAVEIVEASPELIHRSRNAQRFGVHMRRPLLRVASAADTLLQCLSRPHMHAELYTEYKSSIDSALAEAGGECGAADLAGLRDADSLAPSFAVEAHSLNRLLVAHQHRERVFLKLRRRVFYRHHVVLRMEDFAMVQGFFMFHHRHFVKTLANFVRARREREHILRGQRCRGRLWRVKDFFLAPLFSCAASFARMVRNNQYRPFKEACKTALALSLSVILFLQYEPDTAIISGPAVIALVSGANTGEALQGSMMRLIGTLFGAVLAFMVVTVSRSVWQIILGLSLIIFVFSFFRTGAKFGGAAFYACFVAIAVAVPDQTSDAAMRRVQQNTVAILIYVIISTAVFPKIPSEVLKRARTASLRQTSVTTALILSRFAWFGVAQHNESDGRDVGLPSVDQRMRLHGHWIAECETHVKKLAVLLRREKEALPLATEEPTLRRRPFPAAVARQFFATQEKFAAIQVTMLAAWRTMLLEASECEVQHSAHQLIAAMAVPVQRFSTTVAETFNMIIAVAGGSTANLTPSLTKSTLRARQQALDVLEAHRRELLKMISASAATKPALTGRRHPPREHETALGGGADASPSLAHSRNDDDRELLVDFQEDRPISNAFSFTEHGFKRPVTEPFAKDENSTTKEKPSSGCEEAALQCDEPRSPARLEQSSFFQGGALPISSLDSAALHSLVLCMISIGFELRQLFVLAQQLQQEEAAAIGF